MNILTLNLDNRETYLQERAKLLKLSLNQLEVILKDLFIRRFEKHEIEVEAYYRIVSHVYNHKARNGTSLIFHLKKLVV